MPETHTVYRAIDSVLSSRARADQVLDFCVEGDVTRARRLLIPGEDADSLMAQGFVTYWLARTESGYEYGDAQDLLTKAARLFLEQGNEDRSLLAGVWVGLCYWRKGQMNEALVWLTRSAQASADRIRFIALLNLSVIHTEQRHWRLGLETLAAAQKSFEAEPHLSRRGKFFQQRGLCYKQAFQETANPESLDAALLDYEAANDHYEQAGNVRFEAAISNNVASLCRVARQFNRAHANADRSITLYERIGDRSNLAQAKDTKANILLDEDRLLRAKRYADQSVALLRNHDPAWVTTPLVTRAKIFCRLGQCSAAQRDFEEAIAIAESAEDYTRAAAIYLEQAETLAGYISIQALAGIFARIHEVSPSRTAEVASRVLRVASSPDLHSLRDLKCAEMKTEKEMILRALESEGGSVTRAAKLLGKTHGGLTHIIKTRHPELLSHCRPITPRRRSVKSPVR